MFLERQLGVPVERAPGLDDLLTGPVDLGAKASVEVDGDAAHDAPRRADAGAAQRHRLDRAVVDHAVRAGGTRTPAQLEIAVMREPDDLEIGTLAAQPADQCEAGLDRRVLRSTNTSATSGTASPRTSTALPPAPLHGGAEPAGEHEIVTDQRDRAR